MIILFNVEPVQAADIGNSFNYGFAEKSGYISMNGGGAAVDYGTTVADATLSGYAWSEKAGYINFDDAGANYSVANDGLGNLSGYAWSEKLGYISFDDSTANNYYQVTIDVAGNFSGYAWSEKAGYINFDDAGALYNATTTWVPEYAPTVTNSVGATNVTSSGARLNCDLTDDGNLSTTAYVYWGDDDAGTTSGNWDYEENLGVKSEGVYYYDAGSLTKNTIYYYRCYAINATGNDWADSTSQFTTAKVTSPIIFKRGVILKKDVIFK